jgi:hypothetical protein
MLKIKLEPDTAQKFAALAAEYDTTVSALMRIALHRFLEAPGRYKHPILREADRTGLSDWIDVMVNPSSKEQIWRLAGRYGDKLNTALLRVALRRLLDEPGDLPPAKTTPSKRSGSNWSIVTSQRTLPPRSGAELGPRCWPGPSCVRPYRDPPWSRTVPDHGIAPGR